MPALDAAEDSNLQVLQYMRMPHEFSPVNVVTDAENSNGAGYFGGSHDPSPSSTPPRPNEPVANLRPPPALPPRPNSRSGSRSPVRSIEPIEREIPNNENAVEEEGLAMLNLDPPVPELDDLVCSVCMTPTTRRCSGCKLEGYCDREHQLLDWPRHANVCSDAEVNIAIVDSLNSEHSNEPHELPSPELPLRPTGRRIHVDAILLPADEDLPRIIKVTFDVLNYRHVAVDLEQFVGAPPSQDPPPSSSSMARWRAARARTVHVDWIEHQWKGGARLDGGAKLSVHFRYDTDTVHEHRCLSKTILGPRIGASLSGTGHSVLRRGDMVVLKHPNTSRELVINASLSDYVYVGEYYRGLWGA